MSVLLDSNANFLRLVAALKQLPPEAFSSPVSDARYQQFVERFPAARLRELSMDEYCVGKGDGNSFCWWLEHGLEPLLGRYMPGNSRGHILYFMPDGTVYKNRAISALTDEEALRYTLAVHATIAEVGEAADWRWIDDDAAIYERTGVVPRVTVGDGRKLRLLSAYHPDRSLPIHSSEHLGHFLSQFGTPPAETPPKQCPVARMLKLREFFELARAEVPALTPVAFMRVLYSPELGLAPVKEESDSGPRLTSNSSEMVENNEVKMTVRTPPLNQILYGPPGTGKTYATIEAALEILDPEFLMEYQAERTVLKARFDALVEERRVRFVTFHQSFSYEDFVEGLRAETDEQTGQLRYTVADGVFKSLCDIAAVKVKKSQTTAPIDLKGRRIWKMSLGDTQGWDASVYGDCIAQNVVLLGYGEKIDFSGCQNRADVRERFEQAGVTIRNPSSDYNITSVHTFVCKMRIGDLIVVSDGNLKFRAIAEITSDYSYDEHPEYEFGYAQQRSVRWLCRYEPSVPHEELMQVRFSQMTLYELRDNSIKIDQLAKLIGAPVNGSPSQGFQAGQVFGRDYQVIEANADVLTLRKPHGKSLPLPMSILNVLAGYVHDGRITVANIRDKTVFEQVQDSDLEPYIVNGYNNILAPLVEYLTGKTTNSPASDSSTVLPDRRVLVIDEINRGNVSRIFGELITLLEPSKRSGAPEALELLLPYSKTRFSVPNNVYLIGTMNTADRSLAGLDIALRRRFVFKEMPPRPELLDDVWVAGKIQVGQLLRTLNQRIEVLLDRDHTLGHAYFLPLQSEASLDRLGNIFAQQILPLLQEYFFEDWERISWVLNDQNAPNGMQPFVKRTSSVGALFGKNPPTSLRDNRWELNPAALNSIESYLNIYEGAE